MWKIYLKTQEHEHIFHTLLKKATQLAISNEFGRPLLFIPAYALHVPYIHCVLSCFPDLAQGTLVYWNTLFQTCVLAQFQLGPWLGSYLFGIAFHATSRKNSVSLPFSSDSFPYSVRTLVTASVRRNYPPPLANWELINSGDQACLPLCISSTWQW